jgi:recombination protein RecA
MGDGKMAKRTRPGLTKPAPSYFVGPKPGIKFVPSGCAVLDCVLGGGWALGRIANVVGDRSTAKTALATEALINFLLKYPKGAAAYREIEAAFDRGYAEAMGLPIKQIDFGDDNVLTVEAFAKDFDKFLDQRIKAKQPGIYVLDSLDALSDEAEMEREVGQASYGMAKAKNLSEFFRKSARKIEQSEVTLLIVSQVRENIGVTFGEKNRRSGGKALDFYASQVIWLAAIEPLKKTISKVERQYGVVIMAQAKKNKVGLPFRKCTFDFLFGYGIEDLGASVEWLKSAGRSKDAGLEDSEVKAYLAGIPDMSSQEYNTERETMTKAVKQAWAEIETTFLPKRSKYA